MNAFAALLALRAMEQTVIGGLGGAVAEVLVATRLAGVECVGVADRFARTAFDSEMLMDAFGLAVDDLVTAAKWAMARR